LKINKRDYQLRLLTRIVLRPSIVRGSERALKYEGASCGKVVEICCLHISI
jgi:hypothetical protein